MKFIIDGAEPLIGNVRVSSSWSLALKVIVASLFSNDEVLIEGVPNIQSVKDDIEIIKALGAEVDYNPGGKLTINATGLSSSEIPYELGSRNRSAALLAGPLLYRFGKVSIPKAHHAKSSIRPINRWISTWESLGIDVKEDDKYYYLQVNKLQNYVISFKTSTVMGTQNAILCSIFIPGETLIENAAIESEVDDLIDFVNLMGANVKRLAERKILVTGVSAFNSCKYKIKPDKNEAVFFATAALVTCGDIVIEGITSSDLLPFVRKLEAIGANFEFREDSLRVWRRQENELKGVNIETAPAPGFITDWQPLFTVLLTQAQGTSFVHETLYTDKLLFVKDLNRIGAKITLMKPSEANFETSISDDSYDLKVKGEPLTVAKIEGPTPLRKGKFELSDLNVAGALLLAALSAEGKSELLSAENLSKLYENIDEKLKSLGAKLEKAD